MKLTRRQILIGGALAALSFRFPLSAAATSRKLVNGIDISWLPDVEAGGGVFRDRAGKKIDPIVLMRRRGIAMGRIRIFVSPASGNGSLVRAVALAKRLKAAGIAVCVDFHFSDTWADPGHQEIPAAWRGKSQTDLEAAVAIYVSNVMKAFRRVGVRPAWVQIGNEVTNGFMWPAGRISSNDANQWQAFVGLFNAAREAVRVANPSTKVLVHLDCGGDAERVRWWLGKALENGLADFTAVGLSFYSQWHGKLSDLQETLDVVAREYQKPVVIAETAYPWINRTFGSDVLSPTSMAIPGYALSKNGQAKFVSSLRSMLLELPSRRGVGIWWWEGLAIRVNTQAGRKGWNGGMANSTLFDSSGKEIGTLSVLGS